MKVRDALDELSSDGQPAHVFGKPYDTIDGATIVTVAKVRGKGSGDDISVRAKPVGVFVIRGGDVKWEPAIDETKIAVLGVLTGLIAASLATLAMVRRPPWPDLHGTI